jgi:hypothetical protein
MSEGMPPDIVILPGCFPAFLMERQAFAVGRWTILLTPHPNAHPALGTLHQAASRRPDVVLLDGSRVVVTRVGGAGEDQFRPIDGVFPSFRALRAAPHLLSGWKTRRLR